MLKESVSSHGLEGISALLQGEHLESPPLRLHVKFYDSGVARMQLREANPAKARWEAPDIILEEKLTPTGHHMLEPGGASDAASADSKIRVEYISGHVFELNFEPFSAVLVIQGEVKIEMNGHSLFHFEYHRSREGAPALGSGGDGQTDGKHKNKKIVGYWEDGLAIYEDGSREEKAAEVMDGSVAQNGDGFWEESFGGHQDTKPNGPASVGMDITFPGSKHLYGLPEHASSMVLKTTKGTNSHYKEPYRM